MRPIAAVAAGITILVVAGAAGLYFWDAGRAATSDDAADDAKSDAKTPRRDLAALRRRRARHEGDPVDPDADVKAVWDAAVEVYKSGKPIEALQALAPWRRDRPVFFAEPTRAALIREMERAAVAQLARAARSMSLEDAKKLAALLKDLLSDPYLVKEASDLLAAAQRRASATDMSAGADVIEKTDLLADKEALTRHLQRFADRGPAPTKKDWVDNQLGAVAASNQALTKEPDPLNIPDPAEAEKRRLDELEKLRQRNAIGLLDHIDGSLAWLALHQGDDGHFGGDATAARCKALGHNPPCVANGNESYQLAATGLSVLAFLDFRDQDVKRLFEPTLARGIQWIVSQQQPDGSFKGNGRQGYAAAIGLMALGQTASSTGDPDVLAAVQRGITFYSQHAAKDGGYRYGLDAPQGDLSVTGWYVQALEAATNAGATVPDSMRKGLDAFLNTVSLWPPTHRFDYVAAGNESLSLDPVGMLVTSILRPGSPQWYGDDWRTTLVNSRNYGPYWLYYAVRVSLFLDGKVSDKMRGYLNDLAAKQTAAGNAAGMIPITGWPWDNVGQTSATAFCTLILEHCLYRR